MSIFVAVPGSYLKHKRNVWTRQQYKKKAKAKTLRITSQEVNHSEVHISVEKEASKHVVLRHKAPLDWSTTSLRAVIPYVGMALFDQMIMVQYEPIRMRRMGVG